MGLVLQSNTRSRFLEFLNVCTTEGNIPALGSVLRSAKRSWSAAADESGSNPNRATDQHFSSPSRLRESMGTESQLVVLVVEDNAADANLIEEVLAEEQVQCVLHILQDGAKAIDFIDRVDTDSSYPRPDLVLLDLNLPKVSGEQVLQRIRTSPRCEKTQVLIVSS